MMWYFLFFFVSGFCSILYELIWLRLAMAQFSVTTAFVSIVLSAFMAGLGMGSVGAGAWIRRHGEEIRFPPLRLYALTELLIGVSALAVPTELAWGHRVLEAAAAHAALSSALSYLISGAWMALTLVPWCACMGATIPVAMFAIRSEARYESRRSFSFLYLANVLGAVAGAVLPLFLIELYGFHGAIVDLADQARVAVVLKFAEFLRKIHGMHAGLLKFLNCRNGGAQNLLRRIGL